MEICEDWESDVLLIQVNANEPRMMLVFNDSEDEDLEQTFANEFNPVCDRNRFLDTELDFHDVEVVNLSSPQNKSKNLVNFSQLAKAETTKHSVARGSFNGQKWQHQAPKSQTPKTITAQQSYSRFENRKFSALYCPEYSSTIQSK